MFRHVTYFLVAHNNWNLNTEESMPTDHLYQHINQLLTIILGVILQQSNKYEEDNLF